MKRGHAVFTFPLLLEEFERFPDLVVEGCGNHLVFFRPRKVLEPAAFPRFQDERTPLISVAATAPSNVAS